MIPLVVLVAEAGTGKDALGARLAEKLGAVPIGFADPLKQMAGALFGFTDDQLYGPSASRNAVDPRFGFDAPHPRAGLRDAEVAIRGVTGMSWCKRLLPGNNNAYAELVNTWLPLVRERALQDGGLSARFVLQTLGTEWGRALQADLWVDYAHRTALKLLCGGYAYSRRGGLVAAEEPPAPLVAICDGRFPNEAIQLKARGAVALRLIRVSKEDTTTTGVAGHASEALMASMPAHFFDAVILNDGELEDLLVTGTDVVADHLGIGQPPLSAQNYVEMTAPWAQTDCGCTETPTSKDRPS